MNVFNLAQESTSHATASQDVAPQAGTSVSTTVPNTTSLSKRDRHQHRMTDFEVANIFHAVLHNH